jgi:large subunit ribosomal protein L1
MLYNPVQALHLMRLHTFTSFPESVEVCIRLNVNPKNGEQIVRGTANLPAGLGKEIKTAILCSEEEWKELQAAEAKVDFRLK